VNTLNSSTICAIIIVAASVIVIALVITAIVLILKSPFRYPYFRSYFNVSGKRNPKIDVFIDEYLNLGHFSTIKAHHKDILLWKQKCQERIQAVNKYLNSKKQNEKLSGKTVSFLFG
jgi:hypothetical protein